MKSRIGNPDIDIKILHLTKLIFQVNIERIVDTMNASGQLIFHVEEKVKYTANGYKKLKTQVEQSLQCEMKSVK